MLTAQVWRLLGAASALAAMVAPAAAHHPMGGELPETFMEGLLSGLGHPVIGPDHLAFILAVGIAAAVLPGGVGLIAAFIAASTAGVLMHVGAVDVPMAEALVAGSVILAGALVAMGYRANGGVWLALGVLAGLVHGYAFGEAVIGADRAVLGAYLVGLAAISAAMAAAAMVATRTLVATAPHRDTYLRTAGIVVGCVGVGMLAKGLLG